MLLKRGSLVIFLWLIALACGESNEEVDVSDTDNSFILENEIKKEDEVSLGEMHMDYSRLYENTGNGTMKNNTSLTNSTLRVTCIESKALAGQPVEIVNATRLTSILQFDQNVTSRSAPGKCVTVLFYSPSCPFSCQAAPHYNALHRHFRDIKMVAVDAVSHRSFNTQCGINGIPMLVLFHNGRPVAKLNETNYSLKMFAVFIMSWTNLKPTGKLVLHSSDFLGPISSVPGNETDYYLLLSWIVIILQLIYTFYCSSWGRWLVDATLSAWREAEDQHRHID